MKTAPPITRDEIKASMDAQRPLALLDVLPPEACGEVHLPGARNACVYDMTFVDQVRQLFPDRETPLVLYCSGPRNQASATAAEKLLQAGYVNIRDYRGGVEDWVGAGLPVEGTGRVATPVEQPADGTYGIDCERSRIEWIGRNITGAHSGTLKLLRGTIEVTNGQATRGAFTVDMDSIEDSDIPDSALRQMLVAHLKSDDFFDVRNFPTAEFELARIDFIETATQGSANTEVRGQLILKGVSREIVFPATVMPAPDGLIAAEAHFDIDRTQWNVRYGSGRFYEMLGKHLVYDNVTVGLKLITLPR